MLVKIILVLAIAGVAVAATSTGFLGGFIDVTVQDLGVGSDTIKSPLSFASVDLEVSLIETLFDDGFTVYSVFNNVIDECSFHSNEDVPGEDIIIICKLTDWNHQVIAEGQKVFPDGYIASERETIPIQQLSYDGANDVKIVDDVTLVVLGDNPTIVPPPQPQDVCSQLVFDTCIDFDGIATSGRGISAATTQVFLGAPLTTWPTGFFNVGIDFFDSDADGAWDIGLDALHSEDPFTCGTAFRDSLHNTSPPSAFQDCPIIDLSGLLVDGLPVSVDLETGTDFAGFGLPVLLKFHDGIIADGFYNNGEDIILDGNGNGILD